MTRLHERMQAALANVDRRRERRALVATGPLGGGRMRRGEAVLVDFSSNDYLGLADHPLLRQRSAEYAVRYGPGARASRLVTGTLEAHVALEARIAAFKQQEAALLFPSGWHCNAAVLAALLKAAPDTLLFTDRLIHASLHAGAAGHRQIRFRHNDLDHLEALLAEQGETAAPKLIVTESVFSMDGDRVDLCRLGGIARRHGAFVYLDEAHATGVIGHQGAGLSSEHPGAADLVMGTFSKAFGCFGAYVAGSRLLIDYLLNACGGFIFSTAPPPAMLGAIDAALDLVPGMEAQRAHLAMLGDRLRARLGHAGLSCGASSTQIVPVLIGEAARALAMAEELAADGMLAIAIRPPTVPPGTSRLRIALHADHAADDVDRLAAAIEVRLA